MPFQELPASKTPVSPQDLYNMLVEAHAQIFHTLPDPKAIFILLAHGALETGWWKSCFNFNLGNFKSRVPSAANDWCFYECDEVFPQAIAQHYANDSLAKVGAPDANGDCVVWFYPKHPVCCFEAWTDLKDAAYDYLHSIVNHFSKPGVPNMDAWAAAERGDPVAFCHALKLMGYYTADEAQYTADVAGTLAAVQKLGLDTQSIIPVAQILINTTHEADTSPEVPNPQTEPPPPTLKNDV